LVTDGRINAAGNFLFSGVINDVTQPEALTAAGLWNINSVGAIQQEILLGDEA
jgi:hypothetical protein